MSRINVPLQGRPGSRGCIPDAPGETGIPILPFLLVGYISAVVLSFHCPNVFSTIAFDAGGVASGVIFLFPRFASDGRTLFAMIFVLGIVLGLNALLPKLVWLLEKLRLSATVDNTDDLIPSGWYIISRKLAIYLGAILVVSMFSFALYAAVRLSIISNIGGIIQ